MSFIISIEASDLFLCFYVTKNITVFLYVIFIFGNVFLKYNLNWESWNIVFYCINKLVLMFDRETYLISSYIS